MVPMTKHRAEELLLPLRQGRANDISEAWTARLIEALMYVIETSSKLEDSEVFLATMRDFMESRKKPQGISGFAMFRAVSTTIEQQEALIRQMYKAINAIIDEGQIRKLGRPAGLLGRALVDAETLFPELKEKQSHEEKE